MKGEATGGDWPEIGNAWRGDESFDGAGEAEPETREADAKAELLQQALDWHLEAEALENRGDTHQALALYRKAAKIDPNVEYRAYECQKQEDLMDRANMHSRDEQSSDCDSAGRVRHDEVVDLKGHMAQLPLEWQYIDGSVQGSTGVTRFGSLPPELIVRVLIFTFGRSLDVPRMVQLGEVCRAMYKILQDEELWRQMGGRIWKDFRRHRQQEFDTWGSLQRMCIERPRVHFHGLYISRHEYHRTGERTWDSFYTPQHRIIFYRYIRCFSDGSALVITTADRPEIMVPRLKRAQTSLPNGFTGTFQVTGDRVKFWLSKACEEGVPQGYRNRQRAQSQSHLHLTITAKIENRQRTFSTRLSIIGWDTAVVRDGTAGTPTQYEVNKFLPFIFSR